MREKGEIKMDTLLKLRKFVMMISEMQLLGEMTLETSKSSNWGGAVVAEVTEKQREGLRENISD